MSVIFLLVGLCIALAAVAGICLYFIAMARTREDQHLAALASDLSVVTQKLKDAEKTGKFGSFSWDFENPGASFWSDEMFALFGLVPRRQLPTFAMVIERTDPRDRMRAAAEWKKAQEQPGPFLFTVRSLSPSGEVRTLKLQGTTTLKSTRTPLRIEGVAHDITKESEVDRAKSEFVSLASHQLKTPLTSVRWLAEALQKGAAGELTEQQRDYASKIEKACERMMDMVNDLLNVSRLELGTFVITQEVCNVCEVAESAAEEQRSVATHKQVALHLVCGAGVPTIKADKKLLRMIFQNLISNAIKYTPSGGSVECEITLEGAPEQRIFIRVSDTGIGIPKSEQGRVFERLHRASNAELLVPDGTGLGLYLIKMIVDHAGGAITFESVENSGSTFHVSLPLEWHHTATEAISTRASIQAL